MSGKLIRYLKSPKKWILFLMDKGVFNHWSDEDYLKLRYWVKRNQKLNLTTPKLFSEKLQWLKLYNRKPEYSMMVDKYEVKQYVAEKIGPEYVVNCFGVWDSFEEIDFHRLPDQFVLKCTQDSGGIIICRDKQKLDIEQARKKINKSLSVKYYLQGREWPYKNVKPRIIAEEYLENDASKGLYDYKVWCFNGKAEYIQFISGRLDESVYEGFYDREWNLQDFTYHNKKTLEPFPKPKKLGELLKLSESLSREIPFARVDFYILPDETIRFGEITFFPMGGMEFFHPDEMNEILGRKIKLDGAGGTIENG